MLVSPRAMPSLVDSVRWVTRASFSTASSNCKSRCASMSITASRPRRVQLSNNGCRDPLGRSAVGELALLRDDAPASLGIGRGGGEIPVDEIDHLAGRLRDADRTAPDHFLKMG